MVIYSFLKIPSRQYTPLLPAPGEGHSHRTPHPPPPRPAVGGGALLSMPSRFPGSSCSDCEEERGRGRALPRCPGVERPVPSGFCFHLEAAMLQAAPLSLPFLEPAAFPPIQCSFGEKEEGKLPCRMWFLSHHPLADRGPAGRRSQDPSHFAVDISCECSGHGLLRKK